MPLPNQIVPPLFKVSAILVVDERQRAIGLEAAKHARHILNQRVIQFLLITQRLLAGLMRQQQAERVRHGLDFQAVFLNENTPLPNEIEAHEAQGQPETVKSLIEKGADVNLKDKNSWTPLHRAAQLGHKEVTEMLINAGAKINVKDLRGRRPIEVAKTRGRDGIVNLLRQHGAKE